MFYNKDGILSNAPSNYQMRDEFANRPRYFEQNSPKRFNHLIDGYFARTPLKRNYAEYMSFISPHYQQIFKSYCVNHLLRLLILYLQNPQHYHYDVQSIVISGLLQFREMLRNKILGLKYNFKEFKPSMMPSKANKRAKVKMSFLKSHSDTILDALLPEAKKLLPLHLKHKAKYAK